MGVSDRLGVLRSLRVGLECPTLHETQTLRVGEPETPQGDKEIIGVEPVGPRGEDDRDLRSDLVTVEGVRATHRNSLNELERLGLKEITNLTTLYYRRLFQPS